jgi:hypothetical protein
MNTVVSEKTSSQFKPFFNGRETATFSDEDY